VALRDDAINFLRQVFGRERAEREKAESPSAEAEKNLPSSIFSIWGREDVGGLLTVSQNLMDKYADYEQMDEYPDINCLAGDTKVYIAEGSVIRPVTIHELAANGGGFPVLAFDVETGRLVTVQGENPRLTANDAPVIELKFANGETIKCTKEHKVLKYGTGYVDASTLKKGDKVVSAWAGFVTTQLSVFSYPAPYHVEVIADPVDAGIANVYDITTKTHNFVANGLVVHNSANHYFTDDATQPDIDTGRTIWVHSKDQALKEMAETLLHKRLKIEDEIWSMVYTTVKMGNNYEEILVTENGVIGLNSLPVPTMRRVEQANGSLIGYVQDITGKFTQDAADLRSMLAGQQKIPDHVALFEEWQVLHTRLRGTARRCPYGFAVSDGARWIWKRLILLEDAMLIYKLCLRGDSQVWTPTGRKAIKDLVEGEEVYSYTTEDTLKKTRVVYKKHNGQDTLFKIRSTHRELYANATHPVLVEWTEHLGKGHPVIRHADYVEVQNLVPGKHSFFLPRKGEDDWRPIKLAMPNLVQKARLKASSISCGVTRTAALPDLAKTIGVHADRTKAFFNGDYELVADTAVALLEANGYGPEHLDVRDSWGGRVGRPVFGFQVPTEVDEDFARWFGFMLGDGFITTRKHKDGYEATNEVGFALGDDRAMNECYLKLFARYAGKNVKHVGDQGGRLGAYSVCSSAFAEFMCLNGFIPGAHEKRLPQWAFEASPAIKRAIIEGLVDADGHRRKNGRISIELCNKAMLDDVRELAMQLGLIVCLVRKRERKGGHVIDHKTSRRMPATTSFTLDFYFKQAPLSEPIEVVEVVGTDDIWDIGVEAEEHNFIANGVPVHNTRAPARFAFYIDVTDIPSDKVESFLRKAKQDLRKQKMVNPRCLTGETPVTCLDGKDRSMRELAEEVPKLAAEGKHHYVFSYDIERNRVVPGKIVGAALSGQKKPIYRVLLDNGAIVRCTGDHPFLLRNGSYKQAQNLTRGESLMPLYLSRGSKGGGYYWKHKDTGLGKARYTHQMVAEEVLDSDYKSKGLNVHHKDENKENNHPSNLELISPAEHAGHRHPIHLQTARKRLAERAQNDPKFQQELYERIQNWREAHPEKLSEANKKAAATKTARADEVYNLIFAMVDQKLHNDPQISSEAMVAWLNGQADFTRIYSSLPTTIKTELSRGCWSALLKRRGFASFADYKQRVVGTTARKNGPQKKRRLAVSGKLNHTVVSVTFDGYEDVYDLTVENYHNFALTAGVFVHNTQRLDMRFNPMDNSEDFFIAVREGRELARVEVLQGPDYQATDDVEYFARKMHGVLKVPRSYLGQDDAIPGKSILSSEDIRAARVTMGIQREVRNSVRRLIQIDLAARGIDPFKNDLQVLMTVPSGIYELAHMEVKNARADFAQRIQPFVSQRYILKNVFKMSDDEIDKIEEERKKDQEEQLALQAAQNPQGGGTSGPLQLPDTSGALSAGGAAPPPGNIEIGPPPGTSGRPNTAREWKAYDSARRIEEKNEKVSEGRHDEIMDTLGKMLLQDRAFAARFNHHQAVMGEVKHALFARNGNGQLMMAPKGRGRGR
jgi:intein/homing endonuclease